MDKQKVIEAYRRGLITLQECGQILGADRTQVNDLVLLEHVRSSPPTNSCIVADNL